MKVTISTNWRMILVNVVSISLAVALLVIQIYHLHVGYILNYGLLIFSDLAYFILMFYLINILQFAGEKISVQTPFSIYLGLQLIASIRSMFSPTGLDAFTIGFGVLSFLVIISVVVSSFKVKNENLAFPYRVLGTAILLRVFLRAGLPLIPAFASLMHEAARHGVSLIGYINLSELIPTFAILYVILQTGKLLTENLNRPIIDAPIE